MEKYENIQEVQKVIGELEKLEESVQKLCKMNDILFEVDIPDVSALRKLTTEMLENYILFLQSYHAGELFFGDGKAEVQANPASGRRGKNATAHKSGLDVELMSRLAQEGKSYREIAKQAGCAPSTVKDRLWRLQQEKQKG